MQRKTKSTCPLSSAVHLIIVAGQEHGAVLVCEGHCAPRTREHIGSTAIATTTWNRIEKKTKLLPSQPNYNKHQDVQLSSPAAFHYYREFPVETFHVTVILCILCLDVLETFVCVWMFMCDRGFGWEEVAQRRDSVSNFALCHHQSVTDINTSHKIKSRWWARNRIFSNTAQVITLLLLVSAFREETRAKMKAWSLSVIIHVLVLKEQHWNINR